MRKSSNTRFSSKIFISKTTFFFMFSHCTIKNSTLRRRGFLERTNSERAVMRFCEHCSRLQKKCRVGNEFDRCIECVHLDRKCNLTFSMMKWKRIKAERDRVLDELLNAHKQVQEIFARTTRLQKQFVFLKNKKQTMIEREFRNIVELEKNERKASEPSLDDLLFDVFFEQVEIPPGFD